MFLFKKLNSVISVSHHLTLLVL